MVLFFVIGCGGSNISETVGPSEGITIYDIVRDGWYYYEQGEYEYALSKFDQAVKIDNRYADAYNGLGWTYLALQNVSVSLSNFEKMIDINENGIDGWVGETFTYFELGMYNKSNESALMAVSLDSSKFDLIIPDYIFSHNSVVTAKALRITMALNYFYLGDFEQSYFILREYINSTINLDTKAEDFPEKLLNELEKL